MRQAYKTNNILWCLGDDFAFNFASKTYELMDNIIQILNENTDQLEFRYSTLEEYYNDI